MAIVINPVTGLRDITIYPSKPLSGAAAREQIQGIIDQVVTQANAQLDELKNQISYIALLTDCSALSGSYTILVFNVSKNIDYYFPLSSNALRIFDNSGQIRDLTPLSVDTTSSLFNSISYYCSGGDVRSLFTAQKLYEVI